MAGKVKLPVLGEVPTPAVVVGVLAVVGIVGYSYVKRKNAAAAASSSTPAAAASSSTIDPQTGLPEGSPEDQAALAALQDGSAYTAAYGQSYGDGYGYGYAGIPGIPTTTSNPNSGPGTFSDNAYWLAWAEQNIAGYDPASIQAALSLYLQGLPLSTTQYSIYQVALGVAGPPPNPPAVTPTAPSSGGVGGGGGGGATGSGGGTGGGTGGGGATPVSVPNLVGERVNPAEAELDKLGLHFRSTTGSRNPAHEYVVASQSPSAGTSVAPGSVISLGFKEIG